jgi:hypothetical protein
VAIIHLSKLTCQTHTTFMKQQQTFKYSKVDESYHQQIFWIDTYVEQSLVMHKRPSIVDVDMHSRPT